MKYIDILRFTMLTLILTSCGRTDNNPVFYGKTIMVDYPKQINVLTDGRIVELEGEYTGLMNAYDGILMFTSYKHSDGLAYLYDVETGKRIRAILRMGQGPDEVIDFMFNDNFEKDSNGLYLRVSAINNKFLIRINMQGEFVEKTYTARFKTTNEYGIGQFFMLNDSSLIAYMQGYTIFEDGAECVAPSYRIFNYKTGEIIRDYKFYSDYTAGSSESAVLLIFPEYYLSMLSKIKPDKSKLAMAMSHLKRLNILDIESDKVKSIETQDSPPLNFISLGKPVHRYYEDLFCDDDYIFVVESTTTERTEANAWYWYETLTRPSGRILVYDWDGNFVCILQVKEDVSENFAFDPVRRILYTKTDDETVRAYGLNFLYK